jgi:hypothetical protein
MKWVAMAAACAALSGCGSWHKPGASDADFYNDKVQCQTMAQSAFPVNMVTNGVVTRTPTRTNCQQLYGGQVQCTTIPGTVIPAQQTDSNAIGRAGAMNDCLRGKGWSWKSQ